MDYGSYTKRTMPAGYRPMVKKLKRILAVMDSAEDMNELTLFPGWRLHRLKGELKDYWSISITGNWRIIFRFKDGEILDVDLIDYH